MHLVFDIGGTKTRFAYTSDLQTFSKGPQIFYTNQDYQAELNQIREFTAHEHVEKCIGGIPGIINNGILQFAPNLPNYVGNNLISDLKGAFNASQIEIKNDAQIATLGEYKFGAGIGYSNICYLTFGTGIGGGVILDNKLQEKIFEPGHSIMDLEKNITFEESISGGAIRKAFNGSVPEVNNREFWSGIEKKLSALILNIYLVYPVDLFILGGGIITNGNINLDSVKNEYSNYSRVKNSPEIKASKLGDFSGLYGGLVLLNQNL